MNLRHSFKAQRGFTLVELMIALVLGLVLIGGVISVLLSNQQTYRTNTALSQLQDNARTAFELLARDIRQAGSTPCGNASVTNLLTSINGAGTDTYIWGVNPIQGFDNATAVAPALTGALAKSALVTKGVGVVSTPRITAGSACATGATLTAAPSGITAGDLVLMCDAGQAYVYQAGAFAGGLLTMGGTTPGNASATTGCSTFGQTAYVAQYQPDYWYVAPAGVGASTANPVNSLYRARYSGATNAAGAFSADEIIRGVDALLLTYHVQGNAGFVNAAGVGTNWANVDAVQVSITLRTFTNANNANAQAAAPLVRTFTTTIGIRR